MASFRAFIAASQLEQSVDQRRIKQPHWPHSQGDDSRRRRINTQTVLNKWIALIFSYLWWISWLVLNWQQRALKLWVSFHLKGSIWGCLVIAVLINFWPLRGPKKRKEDQTFSHLYQGFVTINHLLKNPTSTKEHYHPTGIKHSPVFFSAEKNQ